MKLGYAIAGVSYQTCYRYVPLILWVKIVMVAIKSHLSGYKSPGALMKTNDFICRYVTSS